ncbi:MAG: hypothetical protein Q7T24_06160 [Deltaproteobacteria bacterium]|nr:hypothetical protein [Deltaproteobacteria bacterium]
MKRIYFPLANKALLAFFVALLPILAVFPITYRSNKNHIEKPVLEDLRTIADEREGLFFLESKRKEIAGLADNGIVKEK